MTYTKKGGDLCPRILMPNYPETGLNMMTSFAMLHMKNNSLPHKIIKNIYFDI